MWFYVGTLGQPAGQANPDGWLPFAGINTTIVDGSTVTPLLDQYVFAAYWGITVLSSVGFGDITPQTNNERIFSIIVELFGCILFAMLVGGLSGIFGSTRLNQKVSDNLDELREWSLHRATLHKKLHSQLLDKMAVVYEQEAFSEEALLHRLEGLGEHDTEAKDLKDQLQRMLSVRQATGDHVKDLEGYHIPLPLQRRLNNLEEKLEEILALVVQQHQP